MMVYNIFKYNSGGVNMAEFEIKFLENECFWGRFNAGRVFKSLYRQIGKQIRLHALV